MSLADDLHAAMRPLAEAIARAIQPTEQPEPEPVRAFEFVNESSGEWRNGVSIQAPRFFLRDTPEARQAITAGSTVHLSDGSTRRVVKAEPLFNNLLVTVEGAKLDASVGHPNTLSVVDGEPVQQRQGIIGVNLGMGAGAPSHIPGVQGTNYRLPVESEIIRAKSYGLTRFRIGGLFERFFVRQGSTEMYTGAERSPETVLRVGRDCHKHGCTILWDPFHNYGTLYGKKLGAAGGVTIDQFAQAWRAFILHIRSDPHAWAATYGFDIMNEWAGVDFPTIFAATQRVLDVCADALGDKLLIVEGMNYSSTANWVANNDGFTKLKDPRGPGLIEFSGHLYLDQDAGGFYRTGDTARAPSTPETVGVDRLKGFADWLDHHGYRGNIGETIVPGDMPRLLKGLENMLVETKRRGIDVYVFGMGDWFNKTDETVHNLETTRNRPTLELVKRMV